MTEPFRIHILGLFQSGKKADAIQELQTYCNGNPTDWHALHFLGILFFRSGQFHEAHHILQQVIASGEGNATSHAVLVHSLRLLGSVMCLDAGERAIASYPDSAECYHELGLSYVAFGSFGKAAKCFGHATRLSPQNSEYRFNLALALMNEKQYHDARIHFSLLAESCENRGEIWYYAGICSGYEKEFVEAYAALDNALRFGYPAQKVEATIAKLRFQETGASDELLRYVRDGYNSGIRDEEFLDLFGEILYQLKAYDELTRLSATLTDQNLQTVRLYNLTGLALMELELYTEAETQFRKCSDVYPNDYSSLVNLSLLLQKRGALAEAVFYAQEVVRRCPNDPEAIYNLATLQIDDNSPIAEALFRRVLDLSPQHGKAYNHLGIICMKQDRYDEASHYFGMAQQYLGETPEVMNNRGLLAYQCRDFDGSECLLRDAVSKDHESPEIHRNLAFSLLAQKKFQEGWKEYSWRLKSWSSDKSVIPIPDISQMKRGMKLLVLPEQGLGDTIQCIRYFRELQHLGVKVQFDCPDELVDLLNLSGFGDTIVNSTLINTPDEEPDMTLALLSVPGLFIRGVADVSNSDPYLSADPQRVQKFRSQFDTKTVHCGITWQGNKSHKNDHRRSLSVKNLLPLFQIEGVKFHSVQKDVGNDSVELLKHYDNFVEFPLDIDTVADTAALIMNLDVLITVDTMIAHLAGALGKKVLLLLPFAPDWRWECTDSFSGWYGEMEQFRQKRPADWSDPIAKVGKRLSELVKQWGKADEELKIVPKID